MPDHDIMCDSQPSLKGSVTVRLSQWPISRGNENERRCIVRHADRELPPDWLRTVDTIGRRLHPRFTGIFREAVLGPPFTAGLRNVQHGVYSLVYEASRCVGLSRNSSSG